MELNPKILSVRSTTLVKVCTSLPITGPPLALQSECVEDNLTKIGVVLPLSPEWDKPDFDGLSGEVSSVESAGVSCDADGNEKS